MSPKSPNDTDGNDTLFDVFLSHNSKDKPAVIESAETLRKDGVKGISSKGNSLRKRG